MSELSLFDAIYAQRAIRRFRPDPIPQEVLERILNAAIHAPSGGNSQPWSFLVVTGQSLKDQLGVWYQDVWENIYTKSRGAAKGPVWESAEYLAYNFAKSPAVVLPCIKGKPDDPMTKGASIYPAVQNMMLAALALGIGSVITTFLQHHEQEVKDLLGMPADIRMACAVPMGYPGEGEHFGGARRKPLHEVVHFNGWGKSAPLAYCPHTLRSRTRRTGAPLSRAPVLLSVSWEG
ncbi:MAG: nitroreductase family protein [Dehalococcoidia bacterium]